MTKEQKFYKALQDIFIGAKIEGQGGFVNLMRIKSNYYSKIEKILKDDIENALKQYPTFREELFDKLYSFFNRYFTESGSIYFNSTPFHNNIYEKVYTDDKDVILFWKTQMLYYVKTDRIFRSIPVEFDGYKFYFDASTVENKKANEKRSLIYELKEIKEDKTIVFNVYYSEKGKITKTEDLLKELKKKQINIDEETLERAFRIFEKQSEVDFFINKNAKAFLQEQFKLWSYQYFWEGAKEWTADRVNQLQILKDISFKVIDFISQFEDELVKIWNKPKFVKNSNYVITLDRINKIELIEKILNHKSINEQIKEWQDLGIVDENFKVNNIFETDIYGKHLSKKYEHLPIDTRYFKDLELEILSLFDDLDNQLDGWLIKSENYQALNTILPKFKEKVQTIYIDPPYNTGSDGFVYNDRFQHASWLTMMENRLNLARELMCDDGVIFVSIDDKEQEKLKVLMSSIFGKENFLSQLIRGIPDGTNLRTIGGIKTSTEYVISFLKDKEPKLNRFLFKDNVYIEITQKTHDDSIETRLTKRGNRISEVKFSQGTGIYSNGLNIEIKEGNYINPNSREKILVKKGNLIIKDGILLQDVILEAPWSMPGVLDNLFLGKEVFDDSGQKYEYVFFKNNGIPYIVKSRNKTLIPSYLEVKNKKDELFVDLMGYSESPKEATPKPIELIYLLSGFYMHINSIILDFFAGSGTTAHAVMKLNKKDGGKRKFILVEIGEYFETVIVPRIKKVAYSFNWKDGKAQDADGIGGFFKYYELEQYEETLANTVYENHDLFIIGNKSPYEQYVFMKDEKMLKALEIDYENKKVKVDLSKLYPNIDIAETLSNLTGKWIKKIKQDEVEFEDGSIVNTKDLDYKLIKPLIWWE